MRNRFKDGDDAFASLFAGSVPPDDDRGWRAWTPDPEPEAEPEAQLIAAATEALEGICGHVRAAQDRIDDLQRQVDVLVRVVAQLAPTPTP